MDTDAYFQSLEHLEKGDRSNTFVRAYRRDDIPIITAGVKRYVPALKNYKGVEIHEDRLASVLNNNYGVSHAFQCFLLTDRDDRPVGGVAAYCSPALFSWDKVVSDVFMFVHPAWRSLPNSAKLLQAQIAWGKAVGAKLITASHTGGFENPRHEELWEAVLKREGFQPIGKLYHYRRDEYALGEELSKLGD